MSAAALLLAALPLLAATGAEREELHVIGWNDACSVAVKHLLFPRLGEAISGEPIAARIGTVTIPPGEQRASPKWFQESRGALSWDAEAFEKVEKQLRALGYEREGFPETIRPQVSDAQPGLAETLLSTRTLALRPGLDWPGEGWRWTEARYSPLGTCALLLFEDGSSPPRPGWLLARVYNPRARLDRSRAHAANARLQLEAGELELALAEAATAAGLAPESALARYVHAGLLSLSGRTDAAVAELRAAIALDPEKTRQAREDRDFDNLRAREDFKRLVGRPLIERVVR